MPFSINPEISPEDTINRKPVEFEGDYRKPLIFVVCIISPKQEFFVNPTGKFDKRFL